jgi:hypothetical protein
VHTHGEARHACAGDEPSRAQAIRRALCLALGLPGENGMSHKNVEMVIGRLTTDEALRKRFSADPKRTLLHLQDSGLDLTAGEIDALCGTPVWLWMFVAAWIHPRLQKIALKSADREK